MVLNYIWIGFFLIALVVAIVKSFLGETDVFAAIVDATFETAELGASLSLGLIGVLCLWMGLMKIGENGGSIQLMSRAVNPFFNKLFPDVPEDHPARGSMLLNFAANMLGLDNAATPAGLKAMNELQEINPKKDTASNAQIMFLVLNTSGLTLIPVTVMTYRSTYGAASPSDIFIPILLSTFFASLVGLIGVAIYQKINLFNKVIIGYIGGVSILIAAMLWYFTGLEHEALESQSALLSNVILFGIICFFIILAFRKKINVYESFIEGAKGGFEIAIKIIPFLIAILVAIGVFKASGSMDLLRDGLHSFFGLFFENTAFVDAVPTAIMKPLSGSGARGMMISSWQEFGVDSFVGKLTATLQGATDTTFYIIAVYFGSVAIKHTRYALGLGLLADLAGIVAAIIISTVFFTSDTEVTTSSNTEKVEMFLNHESESADVLLTDVYIMDTYYDTIAKGSESVIKFIEERNYKLEFILDQDGTTFVKVKDSLNEIHKYQFHWTKNSVNKIIFDGKE